MNAEDHDTTCTACPTRVRWYISMRGKVIALDAQPHPDGNIIIITTSDDRIRAHVLTGLELPAQQAAYRRHKCPPAPARPGPPCTTCHRPTNRRLFELLRWTDHPACDPEHTTWVAEQKRRTRRRKGRR
jgi:hypothetical protein